MDTAQVAVYTAAESSVLGRGKNTPIEIGRQKQQNRPYLYRLYEHMMMKTYHLKVLQSNSFNAAISRFCTWSQKCSRRFFCV